MGTDKILYKNGKYVANLGRAYHFENLWDEQDINEFILRIAAQMHWSFGDNERLDDEIQEYSEKMRSFIDECKRLGAKALLDYMLEDNDMAVKNE